MTTKKLSRLNLLKSLSTSIVAILLVTPWISQAVSLENPLGATTAEDFIGTIIRSILGIVGALALLYFVLGGLQWMTSQGSPDKVKKGKETIVWATFGLGIIFLSYSIVNFVLKSLLSK